jgi:hypothetical protein
VPGGANAATCAFYHLKARDLKDPGDEIGPRLELRRLPLRHQKCLLQHILRRREITWERDDEPFDPRLVADEELAHLLLTMIGHATG